jgi:hypothetical protein
MIIYHLDNAWRLEPPSASPGRVAYPAVHGVGSHRGPPRLENKVYDALASVAQQTCEQLRSTHSLRRAATACVHSVSLPAAILPCRAALLPLVCKSFRRLVSGPSASLWHDITFEADISQAPQRARSSAFLSWLRRHGQHSRSLQVRLVGRVGGCFWCLDRRAPAAPRGAWLVLGW